MKILPLIIACTTLNASAKWAPLSLKSLVEHSHCIVVAEFLSDTNHSTSPEGITQHANLKITSVIKGEAPENLLVIGHVNTMICAPQFVFPSTKGTKYLLFLNKSDNSYSVVNGPFGALTITDNKVTWFTDETKMQSMTERKPVDLETAIAAIKSAISP